MRRAVLPVALTLAVAALGACSSGSSNKVASGSSTTQVTLFKINPNWSYCDLARQIQNGTNLAGPAGPADLKVRYAQFDAEAPVFVAKAPGQIKADAQALINGIRPIEAALAAANWDVTKVNLSAVSSLTDPNFRTAESRVTAYNVTVCKLPAQ
jgi:hypothetical protein